MKTYTDVRQESKVQMLTKESKVTLGIHRCYQEIKGDTGHTQMLTKESKVTLGIHRYYKGIKGDTGHTQMLPRNQR